MKSSTSLVVTIVTTYLSLFLLGSLSAQPNCPPAPMTCAESPVVANPDGFYFTSTNGASGTAQVGQSFTPCENGSIESLMIFVTSAANSNDPATLIFRDVAMCGAAGTVGATSEYTQNITLPTVTGFVAYRLTTPYQVTAGQTYAFFIDGGDHFSYAVSRSSVDYPGHSAMDNSGLACTPGSFTCNSIYYEFNAPTEYVVNNTDDNGPGSLRFAVGKSSALAFAGVAGPFTIDVDLPTGSMIDVTSASTPDIQAFPRVVSTTINGNGVILRMVGNQGRFFHLDNSTINDIIFDGGQAGLSGGSLFATSTNTINRCMVLNAFAGTFGPGSGGAIRINNGTTTINQSIIRNNMAWRGAAVWIQTGATLNLNNSTIADNTVVENPDNTTVPPAAIFLDGTLNMMGNIIANTLPDGAVDLYDSGNTIAINEGNLVENFVCGGGSCMDEEFASTEDPGIMPESSDPYFVYMIPSDSPAAAIGAGTSIAPGGATIALAGPTETIPTVGEWGVICLMLILMIFSIVAVQQEKTSIA